LGLNYLTNLASVETYFYDFYHVLVKKIILNYHFLQILFELMKILIIKIKKCHPNDFGWHLLFFKRSN